MTTTSKTDKQAWWDLELEGKPNFEMAMKRVYAWYEQEIIDRPPVRFIAHNAAFNVETESNLSKEALKARWFNEEYQVERFMKSIEGKTFHGETFPTDIHPGEDCAMAWRGPQQFCIDLYDHPAEAKKLIEIAFADFHKIFDQMPFEKTNPVLSGYRPC